MADSVGNNDSLIKHRRWRYVAFALVVFAALYLLIFLLPEPRLTLDYLKALIWPVLVAVALYWLREPLRQKVAELLNIKGPGFEAQFVNNQRLQMDVNAPAATVLADTIDAELVGPEAAPDSAVVAEETPGEDHVTVPDHPEGDAGQGAVEPTASEPEPLKAFLERHAAQRVVKRAQEKKAIEEILRVGAWWGYDMAKLGFKTHPTPVVAWTEDDRLVIEYAKGDPQPSTPQPSSWSGDAGPRQT